MRKNTILGLAFFLLVAGALILPIDALAQTTGEGLQYQPLEKIPGAENLGSDLPGYIKNLYNVALVIVVLSAVFMLSVGGFMYLTSAGNTSAITSAKGIIFDSLIGLAIALTAWVFLSVINPDLVNVSISPLSPVKVEGAPAAGVPPSVPPVTPPPTGTYTHAEALKELSGITVTSTGGCLGEDKPGCTTLEGIPKSTVQNIKDLKKNTGCPITITGATEKSGHSKTTKHGPDSPVVDVDENSCLKDAFIQAKQEKVLGSKYKITNICAQRSSQQAAYNCSHIEPNSHFHVQFQS